MDDLLALLQFDFVSDESDVIRRLDARLAAVERRLLDTRHRVRISINWARSMADGFNLTGEAARALACEAMAELLEAGL
jgi:hypothetical protein